MFKKQKDLTNARIEYRTRVLASQSSFLVSEAYNKLRTNLLYTLADKQCPVIGVTSAFKGSGKSLTLANLAIALSQLGKRILVIDCDMRSPVQHRIFNLKNEIGVSEVLGGFLQSGIKVCKTKEYPNVNILTAGRVPPNPSELLAGARMKKLIALSKEKYDMVLIDLPPINVVTDAGVISSVVDGYVFVVRAGMDDDRTVHTALSTLKQMNAEILGVILNGVKSRLNGKRYGRYKKYGYGDTTVSKFDPAVAATPEGASKDSLSQEMSFDSTAEVEIENENENGKKN
ncbi:MAG: CpsD/CapB family tyrosine-protein kinase [Ruminococcaceae bacterium]|nr:CpsD/CapB family tyrosine-protein kinase [Oscillospiraceae bacterium]